MNYSENLNFLQAILEGFVDGILVLTEQQDVIYANRIAQSVCDELTTQSHNTLPQEIIRVCEALQDSRSLYPAQPITIESEITTQATTFRLRAQWLQLATEPHPCFLIRLQDQKRSLQGLAIAEAQKWGLTLRETEVWQLRRSGYTRKDIAAKLFIALDTVKKHLKNIQAKRQALLDEEEWQLSHAC